MSLGMLFTIDTWAGTLDPARAVIWCSLGLLLFLVLAPPRVMAAPGWVKSRWLIRERTVRTDRLVSVRWTEGGAQRVVLRDADGGRAEVDPDVFTANPALWELVRAGLRVSREQGALYGGHSVVRELTRRIEAQTALAILQASGLCEDECV
ncbi:hypothetical protein ACIBJF_06250 [Streptomyces sp. NPDC050743]|uniref:hypothetical protein n=1 Tax=Streptomyces sp. NPDC050743 TaxID=3365634 RepID=UPI0037947A6B